MSRSREARTLFQQVAESAAEASGPRSEVVTSLAAQLKAEATTLLAKSQAREDDDPVLSAALHARAVERNTDASRWAQLALVLSERERREQS